MHEQANVNAQDETNSTPLHIALSNKEPTIAQKLIDMKADVNISNEDNETPAGMIAENNFEAEIHMPENQNK